MGQISIIKSPPLKTVSALGRRLGHCDICPRVCGANRLAGKRGVCRAGRAVEVASTAIHQGEEPPISGTCGSGTIFFSHCSLHCMFCQNWPISQKGIGGVMTIDGLADQMCHLQHRGVHNINLVNPTHYWPQISAAVYLARRRGLVIPILANSNGFENIETLRYLQETVQIWLPDLKFGSADLARQCSGVAELPEISRRAIQWLWKTQGPLKIGADGLATGGVLVRHLALPGKISETRQVLRVLKR